MARALPFVVLQILASATYATRFASHIAQETPFIPGYFQNEIPLPKPTSPPLVVRNLVPRDDATCGYMMSNGAANVCGDNQYCMTTASGEFGLWNCCNPSSCYTATACSSGVECNGDQPYCVTSFMSDKGTTYSRFMCGTTSSLVYMVYSSEDTPQYTQSVLSNSIASASSASAASASAAAASKSTTNAASETASSTSTAQPTKDSDSGSKDHAGLIAGVVVAVVVGLALIGALVYLYRRKSQKKAQPAEMAATSMQPYYGEYKPYPSSESYAHTGNNTMPGYAPVPMELPADHQTYELGSSENYKPQGPSELGPTSPTHGQAQH